MKDVVYASKEMPADYKCSACGAVGCKLWRQYQTACPDLLCLDCSIKDQRKTLVSATPFGRITIKSDSKHEDTSTTDQIGWLVPAIPDEEGDGFWGYSSVPNEGCAWWYRLPLRPGDAWSEVCGSCAGRGHTYDQRFNEVPCAPCGGVRIR